MNDANDPKVTIDGRPVFWKDTGQRVRVADMRMGRTFLIAEESDDKVMIQRVPGVRDMTDEKGHSPVGRK